MPLDPPCSLPSAFARKPHHTALGWTMPATTLLFRDDAYNASCKATIVEITPEGGVIVDRTVFYAQGGGQPGDVGAIVRTDGDRIAITNTVYGTDRSQIVHLVGAEAASRLAVGEPVELQLDWERRFKRMRVHTALHLLSVVLPYPVTGGSIGDGDGRLDFDIPDAGLDKAEVTEKLNALIARDAPVTERWITDEELDANPGLVKTMSVKPPRGSGRVRLVEIEGIDLQPCGGTHVRHTREIGAVAITDIEKKGKQNRRVRMSLVD
jgi:misacylated tRNA(Ala) deacylase